MTDEVDKAELIIGLDRPLTELTVDELMALKTELAAREVSIRNNALVVLAEAAAGGALANLGTDAIKAGAQAAKDGIVGMLHSDGKHAAGRERRSDSPDAP